jgi:DNA-binding response OmpR family regulator
MAAAMSRKPKAPSSPERAKATSLIDGGLLALRRNFAMDAPLVLVVDDDVHIVDLLTLYLQKAGYAVDAAYDGNQALAKIEAMRPALVVLDVMMPGPDGLQIVRGLRRRSRVPVIMLTARTSDVDKISGLRFGADDYITKPFNPDELLARVDAVLRRASESHDGRTTKDLALGGLTLDLDARRADIAGQDIPLTPREFDLLATFLRFPNVALDRDQLLALVWGASFYSARTVDVHVGRLREKLKPARLQIETIWGTGYRLSERARA